MSRTTVDHPHSRRTRRRASSADHSGEGRDRWLISYADLVTLLFALFVVIYAAADRARAHAIAAAISAQLGTPPAVNANAPPVAGAGVLPGSHDALAEARARVGQAFAASERLRSRARVTETERGLVVSLVEAGFFPAGEAAIRDDALPLLDELAVALSGVNRPVRIEGHTDWLPIATARYPSNWVLSASRASAVLSRLAARGVPLRRMSVAGYAGERPAADNATPAGRALNRRVDIVVARGED